MWAVINKKIVKKGSYKYQLCRCSCGRERLIILYHLKNKLVKECKSCAGKTRTKMSLPNYQHGMTHTKIFKFWCRTRLKYPFCDRWLTFINFFNDMGDKPDGFYLRRKDISQPYSKDNCEWVLGRTSRDRISNTEVNITDPIVIAWENMRSYAKRGVPIDNNWLKFDNFHKDMGNRPTNSRLTRIDKSKGYFKDNCYWQRSKIKD